MATVEVGPESTIPGTRAWASAVAANAKRYAAFTEKDVRPLVERYRQLVKHEAWELWYAGQFDARERFCRDVLGYEAEFLDTMGKGVEILEGRGHRGDIPQQLAEVTVLGEHRGRTVAERNTRVDATNSSITKGNSADYIVSRLKRDDPELAELVVKGAVTPNAAAREKGWRKPRIVVSSPDRVAASLLKYMSADDIAQLVAVLGAELLGTGGNRQASHRPGIPSPGPQSAHRGDGTP
jgi:hypothetical protein